MSATRSCLAGIAPVCQNISFQIFAPNALCLQVQICLAIIALSLQVMMNSSLQYHFEQIQLPAKLLDYFLWSNKSNINQAQIVVENVPQHNPDWGSQARSMSMSISADMWKELHNWSPNSFCLGDMIPEGKMFVISIETKKISKNKAVLIVKSNFCPHHHWNEPALFITPPSHWLNRVSASESTDAQTRNRLTTRRSLQPAPPNRQLNINHPLITSTVEIQTECLGKITPMATHTLIKITTPFLNRELPLPYNKDTSVFFTEISMQRRSNWSSYLAYQ